MKNNELLSIAEFAQKAGITRQAVYSQLNNRLKPYCQVVDKQKRLEIRALWEVFEIEVEQPCQPKVDKSVNQTVNPEVEFLRGQVELLQAELSKEREHNRQQAERIAELAAKAQQLTEQAHTVHIAQLTKGKPLALLGAVSQPGGIFSRFFKRKENDQ